MINANGLRSPKAIIVIVIATVILVTLVLSGGQVRCPAPEQGNNVLQNPVRNSLNEENLEVSPENPKAGASSELNVEAPGPETKPSGELIIPKKIYMTSKSKDSVKKEITKSWMTANPFYEYNIYDDNEIDSIVRKNMPNDVYEAFKSLPMPVLKADYFRYIVLYLYGGVYSDTDTKCVRPIDTWNDRLPGVEMIIGMEFYNGDLNFRCRNPNEFARGIQFIQWTIAATPKHPILLDVINRIRDVTPSMLKKKNRIDCDVLDWTGPGIWSDTVYSYLNISDVKRFDIQKPFLHKGVYILPKRGFEAVDEYNPESKVQHLFWGSWKNKIAKLNKA